MTISDFNSFFLSVLTMKMCLNYEPDMLRNLKALYKHTDRFFTIFSVKYIVVSLLVFLLIGILIVCTVRW